MYVNNKWVNIGKCFPLFLFCCCSYFPHFPFCCFILLFFIFCILSLMVKIQSNCMFYVHCFDRQSDDVKVWYINSRWNEDTINNGKKAHFHLFFPFFSISLFCIKNQNKYNNLYVYTQVGIYLWWRLSRGIKISVTYFSYYIFHFFLFIFFCKSQN